MFLPKGSKTNVDVDNTELLKGELQSLLEAWLLLSGHRVADVHLIAVADGDVYYHIYAGGINEDIPLPLNEIQEALKNNRTLSYENGKMWYNKHTPIDGGQYE